MKQLNLQNLRNKPSRNAFDQSYRNLFTAKIGELLPVSIVEMMPGDTVDVKQQSFTRTAPLQSSAFTRLKEEYNTFFVPYRLLWRYSNDVMMNVGNAEVAGSISSGLLTGSKFPIISDIGFIVKDLSTNKNGLGAKLFQMLGYGDSFVQYSPTSTVNENLKNTYISVSPFRVLAYQKIAADWYRNDQWQTIEPWMYNVDYITPSSSTMRINFGTNKCDTFFKMRYSLYPKDYFLGALPSQQFGSVASITNSFSSGTVGDINSNFNALSSLTLRLKGEPDVNNAASTVHVSEPDLSLASSTPEDINFIGQRPFPGKSSSNANVNYVDAELNPSYMADALKQVIGDATNSITALQIRNALALQKYREICLSGNKDYRTQVQKHFDTKVSPLLANKSVFVGGSSNNLIINDIVNQTLNSEDDIPTIKGKGTGTMTSANKYTAQEPGILMTLYSCTPTLDWFNTGIDRMNLKTDATDYPIPELDSIGMQPLYMGEMTTNEVYHGGDKYSITDVIGYQPRYMEWKSNYDRINGEFCRTLKTWVTGVDYSKNSNNEAPSIYNSPIADNLNVDPRIVNNLFKPQSNDYTESDVLYVGLYNEIHSVRSLDANGLPY